MEIRRTGADIIQSTGTPVPESTPEKIAQQPLTDSGPKPLNESTIATRKNDFAMAGMLQQSLLSSQLTATNRPAEPVPASGEKTPDTASSGSRELKLGDHGTDVIALKDDLNEWLKANGMETLEMTDIYDAKTEEAIREFQKANERNPTGKASPGLQDLLRLEANADFQHLNGDVKEIIRKDMGILENDSSARYRLTYLARDRTFAHLISSDSQKSAINAFMSNTGSPENLDTIQNAAVDVAILEKEKTLDHLPAQTKQRVIDTFFAKTITTRNQKSMVDLAKCPAFAGLTTQQQLDLLDGVSVSDSYYTPGTLQTILESKGFQDANPDIKDRIVFICARTAKVENLYDQPDTYRQIKDLLNDPKFYTAAEDEQFIMLNKFRTNNSGEY